VIALEKAPKPWSVKTIQREPFAVKILRTTHGSIPPRVYQRKTMCWIPFPRAFVLQRVVPEDCVVLISPGTKHSLETGSTVLEISDIEDTAYLVRDTDRRALRLVEGLPIFHPFVSPMRLRILGRKSYDDLDLGFARLRCVCLPRGSDYHAFNSAFLVVLKGSVAVSGKHHVGEREYTRIRAHTRIWAVDDCEFVLVWSSEP